MIQRIHLQATKRAATTTFVTVKGLDAYWTYKVTVVAETIKGNSSSHTLDVTTMQADPRAVGGLQARAQGRKCNEPTLKIEWNTLTGRDKRGVIQNYTLHFSTTLGENFTRSFKEGTNRSQLEYVPVSPERQYMIQIWAYSEQKKGEVAPALHVNSGACPPKLPETEAEGFTGPTSLIYFPDVNSEKTQYTLMVNQSFFNDASNGALQERGAIVMDADEGGSYAERFDNRSHFHSEYNRRWTDVKDASTVKSYRVILDHNVRSRRATVVPSGGHKIVLGQDGNCDNDPSANCNGYLRANSKYKVRVYTCTVSGCSVTAPSKSFQTAAYSKAGAIVAATLVPIIIVVLIVIVLVFIMRKQQLG
ncbi:hypothetical protein LSAT2_029436 [Lamellibrachia satsuma]|nr:hypothetical protein LSAT2_029436 [Lamellibrachia satsuma]